MSKFVFDDSIENMKNFNRYKRVFIIVLSDENEDICVSLIQVVMSFDFQLRKIIQEAINKMS